MALAELHKISEQLRNGNEIEPVKTRDFLWWFDAQRRRQGIVENIRNQLNEVGIETVPDFESTWLDELIGFSLLKSDHTKETIDSAIISEIEVPENPSDTMVSPTTTWISRDATYRISKLKAANQSIISVDPSDPLEKAILQMMEGGYSQLPVMTSEFVVKGIITWKSIGCALGLGKPTGPVRDFMEMHHEIRADFSIFDAIQAIAAYDYVLVRGINNKITGIVTSSDLSLQFRALTEPFLLLSEIENLIRNLLGDKFDALEMKTAQDPSSSLRPINDVSDLTFGEYIRLIEEPSRWLRLNLALDRKVFCQKLDKIRQIRNDVMHFDPDGISDEDLASLRNFTSLLKQLERYR